MGSGRDRGRVRSVGSGGVRVRGIGIGRVGWG